MDDVTKKVLAETWSATHRVVVDDGPRCVARMASGIDLMVATKEEDEASIVAIRLAACAPEALRLLLEAEWAGGEIARLSDYVSVCPWCRGEEFSGGHDAGCVWLALMAKAGLR